MNDARRTQVLEAQVAARDSGLAPAAAPAIAESPVAVEPTGPTSEFTTLDGELCYRIGGFDRMPPFLMNLPTDTDLWMFVSSSGGLTAGRRDPDGAIFPYETVDKLHDAPHHTGPVTLLRVQRGRRTPFLWEPFAPAEPPPSGIERSLFKNTIGNRLVFEEIHRRAGLAFRYRWSGSDETGWVRTVTLENLGSEPVAVSLLDGLRNVLPSGAPLRLYQQSSCLVDAYKRVDVDPETRAGIFSLTARITDRPEPAEALRATTVWTCGLPDFEVALSLDAIRAFRRGEPVLGERLLTGRRGNYLVVSSLTVEPGARATWHVAADAGRSHVQVARLLDRLRQPAGVPAWIEASLDLASESLRRIVGSADGIQLSGRREVSVHHFANVLFNNLRGGVFVDGYSFPTADLAAFLRTRNPAVAARHAAMLDGWPVQTNVAELRRAVAGTGDADLQRLCREYLPLYFGRRHGDPSRPWNRFAIRVRNAEGGRALRYEGNWRDVFQNWEALAVSFPDFLPSVIAAFVNASTVDGFNPYRISRDGVDWEVPDPADPWAGIGYWGDHQIVYLLRLLASLRRHDAGALSEMLADETFSYADVPYRLAPYAAMLAHPRSTIEFDHARAATIASRVAAVGQDGKLVHTRDGQVLRASLLEKLVVPALAKLGSFVPGAGIWMNTERPEWNDANNALAGSGVSVVTMCHLRCYLRLLEDLVGENGAHGYRVAAEVADGLRRQAEILERNRWRIPATCQDDRARRRLMDELGVAFSSYRERVYAHGLSEKVVLGAAEIVAWCRAARAHLEHAIRANRREDGLYHAYLLLEVDPGGDRAALRPLDVMLEGQVAALGSGILSAAEAVELLDRLFASPLYRADQASFLLYPGRALPSFLERNRIPDARAAEVALIGELLAAGDTSIVEHDAGGVLRFHADRGSRRDLAAALDRLERHPNWTRSVARDRQAMLRLFEDVFGHRSYTGRSGTMYAYEGLGSVYWHMVAKLLLAVQEVALEADARGEPDAVCRSLAGHYRRIRHGLGFEKSVRDYGAFPTDPYSHTPAHAGAQQPGMTGSVKEEILVRFGELGVRVQDGILEFEPALLWREAFLAEPGTYAYFDLAGESRALELPAGALAFSYCQVPVVYVSTGETPWVRVTCDDGTVREQAGFRLSASDSRAVLGRLGGIARIDVGVRPSRS